MQRLNNEIFLVDVTGQSSRGQARQRIGSFVKLRSLVYSSKDNVKAGGGAAAADAYKQAALLIEFLRESKFGKGKGKFEDFLYSVGRLPRGDAVAIDAELLRIYGADLQGVDAAWQEYCKKR